MKCSHAVCVGLALLAAVRAVAAPPQVVVLLVAQDRQEASSAVASALETQLADLPIKLEVRWLEELPARLPDQEALAAQTATELSADAVLWCDLAGVERAYFYLSTAGSERVLVRRLEGAGQESLADAMAIIGRSYVEGLLDGAVIDLQPPAAPAAPQAPAPLAGPSSLSEQQSATAPVQPLKGTAVSAFAAYSGQAVSQGHPWESGAAFGLELRATGWLALSLGYAFLQPRYEEVPGIGLSVAPHPICLRIAGRGALGRLELGGGLFGVLDLVRLSPRALSAGATASGSHTEARLLLGAAVEFGARVTGPLWLVLSAGAQVPTQKVTYEVQGGQTFPRAFTVQPSALLGARVDLFGQKQ